MPWINFAALPKHEYRTLALMLGLVHLIAVSGIRDELARPLMLAHLGLFLIWQPLISHKQRLDTRSAVTVGLLMVTIIGTLNWTILSLWLLMLIGILSGRVYTSPKQRYASLLALVFVVLELLLNAIPGIFNLATPNIDFQRLANYPLGLLPLALFFMPQGEYRVQLPRSVDFLHGLAGILLILVLALGGLTNTLATGTGYPIALLETAFTMAIFLILMTWLWAPIAGFSGLGQIWERYVQNVGTPFELWLAKLRKNANSAEDAQTFLQLAMEQLSELPWIVGLHWQTRQGQGQLGELSEHDFTHSATDLTVCMHTHRAMGITLMLHARLLVQMIDHFYRAKEREVTLARQAHLHAIYETGARMTHDIKNLLQALQTITAALSTTGSRDEQALNRLVKRQLPHITQRLQQALAKLQSPQERSATESQSASRWWHDFVERHSSDAIQLQAQIQIDPAIPADLFHSVADNLLENIRYKRQLEPDIHVDVLFTTNAKGAQLAISDTGMPIPAELAEQLFKNTVQSSAGLGIGLYQAARQAKDSGYELRLSENDARVSFELRPVENPAERISVTNSF